MSTEMTVFASRGGTAFHQHRDCRAFTGGQNLNDTCCGCDDYCRHRMPQLHAVESMTVPAAMGAGKLPCLVCLPGWTGAWFRAPSEDDFGHEPVDEYADTPFRTHRIVCARCLWWGSWPNVGLQFSVRVSWPCTSAVVLGLAPRPEDTLELTA